MDHIKSVWKKVGTCSKVTTRKPYAVVECMTEHNNNKSCTHSHKSRIIVCTVYSRIHATQSIKECFIRNDTGYMCISYLLPDSSLINKATTTTRTLRQLPRYISYAHIRAFVMRVRIFLLQWFLLL